RIRLETRQLARQADHIVTVALHGGGPHHGRAMSLLIGVHQDDTLKVRRRENLGAHVPVRLHPARPVLHRNDEPTPRRSVTSAGAYRIGARQQRLGQVEENGWIRIAVVNETHQRGSRSLTAANDSNSNLIVVDGFLDLSACELPRDKRTDELL